MHLQRSQHLASSGRAPQGWHTTPHRIGEEPVDHRVRSRCGVETSGRGLADELDADDAGDFYAVDVPWLDDATDEEP